MSSELQNCELRESVMLVVDAHHCRNVSLAPARGSAGDEHAAHQRPPARNALQRARAAHCKVRAFLDLYAGSGAVGIEALSRGAAHVTFVERAPAALKVLRGNLERLGIGSGFRIHPEKRGRISALLPPKPIQNQNATKWCFSILLTMSGGSMQHFGIAGPIRRRDSCARRARRRGASRANRRSTSGTAT